MIAETFHVVTAFMAGLALGAVYLWTLWVVVQRLPRMKHGGFWLLSTACLRIGLLLTVWYWVADERWEMLLSCLLGFLTIRFAATRSVTTVGAKRPTTS
jgi:F1F0 ATPase subunit 2